jgi:tRNA (guanine37-N1)-methyltransferase
MLTFSVITLFPELFSCLEYGITGRALKQGIIQLHCLSPRDFTYDRHRTVDDRPYGGGPGMLMQVQPLRDAIKAAKYPAPPGTRVTYLSPQGQRLDQPAIRTLTSRTHIILVAGRYEGIDERLFATDIDEEWSIGDYVLSGGEFAALVVIDCITRLLPGALGDANSAIEESFVDGLLDYPHYTRPETIEGLRVPDVLLGGNHALIRRWRQKQALGRTWLRRPDLLKDRLLTSEEQVLLDEFIGEQ